MHAAFKTNYGNQFNEVVCGGTICKKKIYLVKNLLTFKLFLVSQRAILTAAHCIYAIANDYSWNVEVHVGRYNVTAPLNGDTIFSATYGIASAVVHNAYDSETNNNDIGIIKTTTYMKFT